MKATPDEIIRAAASLYGVSEREIRGHCRQARLVRARHVAMYVIYRKCHLTYKQVGKIFDNRDHTTVLNACRSIEGRMATEEGFVDDLTRVARRAVAEVALR